MKWLSPSRVADFLRCPASYYWGSERRLEPRAEVREVSFGSVGHEALHKLYESGSVEEAIKLVREHPFFRGQEEGEEVYTKGKMEELVRTYAEYVDGIGEKGVEGEQLLGYPMESGDGWGLRGKMDRVVRWGNGRLVVREWKFSKHPRFHLGRPNGQASDYAWLGKKKWGEVPRIILTVLMPLKGSKNGYVRRRSGETESVVEEGIFDFQEWELAVRQKEVRRVAGLIAECREKGVWPRADRTCAGFGRCKWQVLCLAPPGEYQEGLAREAFRVRAEHREEGGEE